MTVEFFTLLAPLAVLVTAKLGLLWADHRRRAPPLPRLAASRRGRVQPPHGGHLLGED